MASAAEIRAEHDAAMASMTPAQGAAVDRLLRASTMSAFSAETRERRLNDLCRSEASNSAEAPGS